jgi:LacI family transcriptional regulator
VAERTRAIVAATAARLGYRRNQLAAGLRSKRSYVLGLVVNDLTYPHYAQTAVGVEEVVEGSGYSLIVANSHDRVERELQHVETLGRYRADGLIISPVLLGDAAAAQVAATAPASVAGSGTRRGAARRGSSAPST